MVHRREELLQKWVHRGHSSCSIRSVRLADLHILQTARFVFSWQVKNLSVDAPEEHNSPENEPFVVSGKC
jgi:hypothetical protein